MTAILTFTTRSDGLFDDQHVLEKGNLRLCLSLLIVVFREGPAGVRRVDLFSRRVVGWSMSAGMAAQLATDAVVMAIWRRGKPHALLHHSY